ncbi:hypothetical protein [Roseinatronobacter sp. NSM]|uniref:hypothetical protein n=1 Tax=Roseinatronobacter sp. NSM TaxID=3457785 RepID=UPI004035A106
MPLSDDKIKALSIVSQQLREEGAEQKIADMALAITKGQYPDEDHDNMGAIKLLVDTAAMMMVDAPNRPKCCQFCELKFIANHLQAMSLAYSRARDEKKGRDRAG